MAGYVAGVGDRHTDNFLVDLNSGALVPIDFGQAPSHLCLSHTCAVGVLTDSCWYEPFPCYAECVEHDYILMKSNRNKQAREQKESEWASLKRGHFLRNKVWLFMVQVLLWHGSAGSSHS